MLCDFAMKTIINEWDSSLIGPNPFVKIGEFSDAFTLGFDVETLKKSISGQLVKVGELCDKGTCNVHALGGTIAFTVDKSKLDHTKYKCDVLTVATRLGSLNVNLSKIQTCNIGSHSGAAGHVLLTYPSGGTMLCSCGHWIELSKLDVSVEGLLKVAQANYGAEYSANIANEYNNCAPEQQAEVVQRYAKQFVQQSAPCNYSSNVGKW